ncbi:MAG: hypothetical protein ATN32_01455 [Candidatus Epulonipiscium fishelsonii]|nr:MAG: hypothetical protein ATN32_01455 [Epulopiscium sp. AS2M-Bin002]
MSKAKIDLSEYRGTFVQKKYIDEDDELINSFNISFLRDNNRSQIQEMILFLSKKKIILPNLINEQLEFSFEYKDIVKFQRFKMSFLPVGTGIEYRNWAAGEINLVQFANWGREKLINSIKELQPEYTLPPQEEITEEEKWYNAACALFIATNKGNLEIYGGFPIIEEVKFEYKNALKKWWRITDKTSAENKISWLLTQGHRVEFVKKITELSKCTYGINDNTKLKIEKICKTYKVSEKDALDLLTIYDYYNEFGETAIDGWDYVRAINLISQCYLAGYFEKEEALEKSKEIAILVKTKFSSWEALINSYLFGCEFKNKNTAKNRRKQFYDIKSKPNNIFDTKWD